MLVRTQCHLIIDKERKEIKHRHEDEKNIIYTNHAMHLSIHQLVPTRYCRTNVSRDDRAESFRVRRLQSFSRALENVTRRLLRQPLTGAREDVQDPKRFPRPQSHSWGSARPRDHPKTLVLSRINRCITRRMYYVLLLCFSLLEDCPLRQNYGDPVQLAVLSATSSAS